MAKRNAKKNPWFGPAMIAVAAAVVFMGWSAIKSEEPPRTGERITVYKSPTCGCCSGWIAHLRREGFDVETDSTQDMAAIKERYGIPGTAQSCHTAVIGDYVVEGHIPASVIADMLAERPDIKGIALPGMPDGSPGMPGRKTETWEILSLEHGGDVSLFTEL